jgi:hypothetical protein
VLAIAAQRSLTEGRTVAVGEVDGTPSQSTEGRAS